MHIQGRNRVLLGALIAAFALVIPTSAFASHDLGIYKVEKHLDLDSDEISATVSCTPGDYALDGMWRIDHADQDDDDIYSTSLGRAVDVVSAYPSIGNGLSSSGHRDAYNFTFEKNAIGRAQVKMWVVCIGQNTHQTNGHSHALTVTPHQSLATPAGAFDTTATPCPTNTFISTPGFNINPTTGDPNPLLGHVSTDIMSSNMRNWSWYIDTSQDGGAPTIDYYWSCVSRKLVANGGENHKLVYRHDGQTTTAINPTGSNEGWQTVRQSCGAAYKAVVAGFTFPFVNTFHDPNPDFPFASYPEPFLWFLGMDPQPKSRDFRFDNADSVAHNVTTDLICLNYRTT